MCDSDRQHYYQSLSSKTSLVGEGPGPSRFPYGRAHSQPRSAWLTSVARGSTACKSPRRGAIVRNHVRTGVSPLSRCPLPALVELETDPQLAYSCPRPTCFSHLASDLK